MPRDACDRILEHLNENAEKLKDHVEEVVDRLKPIFNDSPIDPDLLTGGNDANDSGPNQSRPNC